MPQGYFDFFVWAESFSQKEFVLWGFHSSLMFPWLVAVLEVLRGFHSYCCVFVSFLCFQRFPLCCRVFVSTVCCLFSEVSTVLSCFNVHCLLFVFAVLSYFYIYCLLFKRFPLDFHAFITFVCCPQPPSTACMPVTSATSWLKLTSVLFPKKLPRLSSSDPTTSRS